MINLRCPFSGGKGTKEIYTPFVKGQENLNDGQIVRWLSSNLWMILALGTTFDQCFGITPEGGPVVSTSKDFSNYSSYSLMYSTSAFVYFVKDKLSFFRRNTFQKGMCIWFFVERSFVEFEPSDPFLEYFFLTLILGKRLILQVFDVWFHPCLWSIDGIDHEVNTGVRKHLPDDITSRGCFSWAGEFCQGVGLCVLGPWDVNQCWFVELLDKFSYLLQIQLHAFIFGLEFPVHLPDYQLGVGKSG